MPRKGANYPDFARCCQSAPLPDGAYVHGYGQTFLSCAAHAWPKFLCSAAFKAAGQLKALSPIISLELNEFAENTAWDNWQASELPLDADL